MSRSDRNGRGRPWTEVAFGLTLVALPGAALAIALASSAAATKRRSRAWRAAIAATSAPIVAVAAGIVAITLPGWWVYGPTGATWTTTGLAIVVGLVAVARMGSCPLDGGSRHAGLGAVAGGVVLAAIAVALYVSSGDRVAAWYHHPNSWGAGVVAGVAAALGTIARRRSPWTVGLVVVGGAVAVAASGSRTAAVGLVAALIVVALIGRPTSFRAGTAWSIVGGSALVVGFVLLATPLGDRLVSFGPVPDRNRILASEELTTDLWTKRDVRVAQRGESDGVAVHEVTATAGDGLARLHQRQPLAPGATVTFSVELAGVGDADPGLHVFSDEGGRISVVAGGDVRTARRPPTVVASQETVLADGWLRMELTVRNENEAGIVFRPGVAPTMSGSVGSSVLVRRPSLVEGSAAGPYQATTERDRQRELARLSASQRLAYVPAALQVFAERPLFGHGSAERFAVLTDRYAPGRLTGSDRPAHPHSLVLDILVGRGLVGLAGWALVAGGLWATVPRGSRRFLAPYLVAVAILNVGDSTLLTGAPLFAGLATLLVMPRRRDANHDA